MHIMCAGHRDDYSAARVWIRRVWAGRSCEWDQRAATAVSCAGQADRGARAGFKQTADWSSAAGGTELGVQVTTSVRNDWLLWIL